LEKAASCTPKNQGDSYSFEQKGSGLSGGREQQWQRCTANKCRTVTTTTDNRFQLTQILLRVKLIHEEKRIHSSSSAQTFIELIGKLRETFIHSLQPKFELEGRITYVEYSPIAFFSDFKTFKKRISILLNQRTKRKKPEPVV